MTCPCLAILVLTLSLPAETKSAGVQVQRDVSVPMRDGVILKADVHRPAEPGSFPALVMRTPYGKKGRKFDKFVKAGYIVICQDARGRYASGGKFESFLRFKTHDAEDGYDTVEWAAKLDGCTGKVGTFGASYNAFLQWRLAALRPPSLVAMSAVSIPARYTDLEGPGTIRPSRRLHWWATTISPDLRRKAGRPGTHTPAEARKLWTLGEGALLLNFLPWKQLPDRVFEDEAAPVRYWLDNPHTDPWKLDAGCPDIAVPNLDFTGWHDHCNSIDLHVAMVARGRTETARSGQRMMVGPWSHHRLGRRKVGDFDFGPAAAVNVIDAQIRWFDYWLKGKKNGIDADPQFRIFVMGANRWRVEKHWPPRRAQNIALFLAGSGKANTPAGDGKLARKPPTRAAADHYTYDPRDPVISLYGFGGFAAPTNQAPLAHRRDILIYQTEPLADPMEVTGYPVVELFAASSAPDTDFFARLIDVSPDGTARDVAMGMVRARYRGGLDKPKLLEPGKVTKFVIRLTATSNEFQSGHRIRLDITSSDFPNYDRNHNTAADQNDDPALVPARQTLHHGPSHASKLILPTIPRPPD